MPAGRPTDYTDDLANEFCRRVASGRSTLSVCADVDMPSDTTVYRWRGENAEFRDKLTYAREERLEAYADRMDALARRVIEDGELDPGRVNAAVNAIDKAARLQQPKKIEVAHSGEMTIKRSATDMTDDELARIAAASSK